jgi:hypothetical protein
VTVEIMACMFITTATLVYIFYLPGTLYLGPRKTRLSFLRERREMVYENLRDLNFEFHAGKFPDADYQSMKTSLEEEAAAVLAEIAQLEQAARNVEAGNKKGARV